MPNDNKDKRIHYVEVREPRHRKIIPYAALVVSIVTAAILVWHGLETRNHYRQVVAPQVIAYTTNAAQDEHWGIFLQNEGVGPAIVKLHRMTIDGVEKDPVEILNQFAAEDIIGNDHPAVRRLMGERLVLKEGSKSPILVFIAPLVNPNKISEFERMINERVDLRYTWCSVYDECTEACTAHMCGE